MRRCVNTLREEGFIENIPETGRIRASCQFARWGMAQLDSLDTAQNRLSDIRNRISQ